MGLDSCQCRITGRVGPHGKLLAEGSANTLFLSSRNRTLTQEVTRVVRLSYVAVLELGPFRYGTELASWYVANSLP